MTTAILAAGETNWNRLAGPFQEAIVDTLVMVGTTLVIGGLCGLILGMLLYTTRAGGILQNKFVFGLLNILVNFVRPIPFIILLVTLGPLTKALVGSQIGRDAAIVGMSVAATFGVARIVEQNLVSIDPGVIEAARAMGASPLQIIVSVIIREALGPLILGFTFIFIAVVDMSAMAGYIGGGGLGDFAITYGYNAFNPTITLAGTIVIILIVQVAQLLGNFLSKKIMRR